MKRLKIGLILSAFTLFIIACGQTANVATNAPAANVAAVSNTAPQGEVTPAVADELASARKNYTEKCVGCHRENGLGGEKILDDGTKIKAPNFTSDRKRKDKDTDWIDTITNGATDEGMPAYKGKLSDGEIKDLVKYIRREFQK